MLVLCSLSPFPLFIQHRDAAAMGDSFLCSTSLETHRHAQRDVSLVIPNPVDNGYIVYLGMFKAVIWPVVGEGAVWLY